MISAEEMMRRATEALDEWRGLSKEAQDWRRDDYVRRLRGLGYPPDVVNRWLDRRTRPSVRKPYEPAKRSQFPQGAMKP